MRHVDKSSFQFPGGMALLTVLLQALAGSHITRRGLVTAFCGAAVCPAASHAKYGDAPTTSFPGQPESTLGSAAQDTGSRQVWDLEAARLSGDALNAKKERVRAEWDDLARKVDAQLKKGQLLDVQSSLALRMSSIKNDVRDVARALNSGDLIQYKSKDSDQPVFDYNSGLYGLTSEAQAGEVIFARVNAAYVAAGRRDADEAASAWADAKKAFAEWDASVAKR